MKIFISWSGPHAEQIALVLRAWLDDVFESATPFMSQADIPGGSRPLTRIEEELEGARFGVVIVTKSNQHAPWITFEAGALSKVINDASQYVMPMLVDLRISDLTGPLSQFQAAAFDEAGTLKMVQSIGQVLELDAAYVGRKFAIYWPELETKLAEISPPVADSPASSRRAQDDILDEILSHVREIRREQPSTPVTAVTGGAAKWVRANTGSAVLPNAVLVDDEVLEACQALGFTPAAAQRAPKTGAWVILLPREMNADAETVSVLQERLAPALGPDVMIQAASRRGGYISSNPQPG